MTTKEKQQLFIIGLEASGGNISKACDLCHIARQTYYNWMDADDPAFSDQIIDIQTNAIERRIDLAESKLDDRLNLGSGPDVRFVLKTLGAKRGYGNQSTITLNPGEGFKDMTWPEDTPDLDHWEAERDKAMPDANATQVQQGDLSTAGKSEGDGPGSTG
jgi:hypothetical protein